MASTMAAVETPRTLPGRQLWVVFGGLISVMLLAALDGTIVATALPTIVGDLGGLDHLAWVVTAYLLAETIATPLYGKLGDLYGRKIILQSAVVIFLAGSALCGFSQSLTMLIIFRAIQGLGGGGLSVLSQAVVGDVVSPRERGRYQGIFGAVFGISSIAGPLLGGYLTTHLSWRWIFFVNIPLGLISLAVLAVTLPATTVRVRRSIDYAGTAFLAIGLSAIVLFTDLGGSTYGWGSPQIIGLGVLAVVALIAFIVVERRAAEPVLPLRLFANRTFAVASTLSFIVGFALFGSVTYLALYLQIVKGSSPTSSGLQLVPLMAGVLVTSIGSGLLISKWGRYRIFPIVGTAVSAAGLYLLSRLGTDTSNALVSLYMLVLGLGLGLVMQVLVLVVQNEIDYADLGVATSGVTLFRLIGGSLGTALMGAIFANRLTSNLAVLLPPGSTSTGSEGLSPTALQQLPDEVRDGFLNAYSNAIGHVFLIAAGIMAVAFALSWLLQEHPLRETMPAADLGDAFAMPKDDDSLTVIARSLATLGRRDVQRRFLEESLRDASLDLSPGAAWLLARLNDDPRGDLDELATMAGVQRGRVTLALGELRDKGMIELTPDADGSPAYPLTAAGLDALSRARAAVRQRLSDRLAGWSPEQYQELGDMLDRLTRDIVAEPAIAA